MFRGSVVWRGLVYSLLMILAKLLCGIWLIRISFPSVHFKRAKIPSGIRSISISHFWGRQSRIGGAEVRGNKQPSQQQNQPTRHIHESELMDMSSQSQSTAVQPTLTMNPISLYPASIISSAMVARGEIGFLISSLGQSRGIFDQSSSSLDSGSSDIFLIITWAIVLCTVVGPLSVGRLVKRVKRLETKGTAASIEGSGRNVLGVWGVS
jgi:hypothetical protein